MAKLIKRIHKVRIKKEELDTSICIDPLTKTACVWSVVPSVVKRLYKLAEEHDDVSIDLDNEFGLAINVPMNWIKIRPHVKRQLTDEQKATLSERMKNVKKGQYKQ